MSPGPIRYASVSIVVGGTAGAAPGAAQEGRAAEINKPAMAMTINPFFIMTRSLLVFVKYVCNVVKWEKFE